MEQTKPYERVKGSIFIFILVIGFTVATTVGLILFYTKDSPISIDHVFEIPTDSIVGHPSGVTKRSDCLKLDGCTWIPNTNSRAPRCVFTESVGYVLEGDVKMNETTMAYEATLKRKGLSKIYNMDVYERLYLTIEAYNENALRIYLRPDVSKNHWEIGEDLQMMNKPKRTKNSHPAYTVEFIHDPIFGIIIKRNSTGSVIFNTTLPGLIFSEQFLQISTKLPSENVYGFGEHNHRRYRHDVNWRTWPIFTVDVLPVDKDWNLYGAHPVHMSLEADGKASMVFLRNSHAMDVTLQPDPSPALTYRAVGGVFDFYIFTGPSPQEAVQQYLEAVGRPPFPPYWALGFHLCRWGYQNLTNLKEVYERNRDAGIPQDVQWADIDYMYEKYMFTYDKSTFGGLPEFVEELHQAGQKFIVILDPGIGSDPDMIKEAQNNSQGYTVYSDSVSRGVLVMESTGKSPIKGKVWPGQTVFPDFTHPNATQFWKQWISYFINSEKIKVDGLWIDMNEPASFAYGSIDGCLKNKWNNPPYIPPIYGVDKTNNSLYYKTLCMDSQQYGGRHYQVHSLYGHSEAKVTQNALKEINSNKRPFVLTRSSFAGTGHHSFKWMGDNASKWPHMHWSIIGILEFGMFGFSMNGADICGFKYTAEREMCIRWFQLGSFYPFARSHNEHNVPDQDPAAWDTQFIQIVRQALNTRYTLLPYYYTVFKDAHVLGTTVARSLMFEFPEDKNTWDIDKQFLIGSNLLISPVLEKEKREVDAYFPKGRWFLYNDGTEVTYEDSGKIQTLNAPLDMINVHLRGGSILPVQEPANTTKFSRMNPMGLLVAMDTSYLAKGILYCDDGESLDSISSRKYLEMELTMSEGHVLNMSVINNGYSPPGNVTLDTIDFYGLSRLPRKFNIDGIDLPNNHYQWNVHIVRLHSIKLDITKNHTITWTQY